MRNEHVNDTHRAILNGLVHTPVGGMEPEPDYRSGQVDALHDHRVTLIDSRKFRQADATDLEDEAATELEARFYAATKVSLARVMEYLRINFNALRNANVPITIGQKLLMRRTAAMLNAWHDCASDVLSEEYERRPAVWQEKLRNDDND